MREFVFSPESDSEYQTNFVKERTTKQAPLDPDSFFNPWNADDLVQKHNDYSLYFDMLKDDQVSVVSNLKKDIMLSSGYDIVCEEEDQDDIKKDVEIALSEDPDWPIEDMFEEMLTHLDFGFSISEKVFKKRDDGSIGLKWIKTRHPGPWLFHQDDAGNIIR